MNKTLVVWCLLMAVSGSAFAQSAAFPNAVAGDSQMGVAANFVLTKLAGDIAASDTVIPLDSVTGIVPNMILSVEFEEVWVCQVNTVAKTVTVGKSACPNADGRAFDGTTAVAHTSGFAVAANVDRWHHESVKREISAIEAKLVREFVSVVDRGSDPTGTVDSATALNTALASCTNLFFPAGTYLVGAQLTMACNGQTLQFDSGAILKKTAAVDLIRVTGADNVIEGIVIDGNGFGSSGIGLFGLRDWIIRGEVKINAGHGIYLDGQTSNCGFNHIDGARVHGNGQIGIAENHCGNNQILNNYVYSNGLEGVTIDNGSNNSVVSGNTIDHNCLGGGVGGIGIDTSSGWTVSGNVISNSQTGCSGLKTQNNLGNTGGGAITGNSIIQNAGFGIWLFTNGSNITFGNVTSGNQIFNNTGASYQADVGCSNNLFTGNAYDQQPAGVVTGVNLITQDILALFSGGTRTLIDAIGRVQIQGALSDQSFQRTVPNTGFVLQIDSHSGTYILDPAGTLAAGTIGLPTTPVDGQLITVLTSQAITSLTVVPGTANLKGASSYSLAANTSVEYMYVTATNTWYRKR